MKLARGVFFGLVMAGAMVFLSSAAFAQTGAAPAKDASPWKAKHEARIKTLQDSAAALLQTNPDLSKKLTDLVTEETNESKEKAAKDATDWKAKREAKMQIYKDAAAALQASHPDLAKSLEEMSAPMHKHEMPKAAQQ